jgi:hypothetical protein
MVSNYGTVGSAWITEQRAPPLDEMCPRLYRQERVGGRASE